MISEEKIEALWTDNAFPLKKKSKLFMCKYNQGLKLTQLSSKT